MEPITPAPIQPLVVVRVDAKGNEDLPQLIGSALAKTKSTIARFVREALREKAERELKEKRR